MNLFSKILVVGIAFFVLFLIVFMPKWYINYWNHFTNKVSEFCSKSFRNKLILIIDLVLTGIIKLIDIISSVAFYIFYNIPIALSFIFVLPCLFVGLYTIFMYNNVLLGLACLICAYVLVKINKEMQGGK